MTAEPLNRLQIAWRTAQDVDTGMLVNLGLGMPVAVGDYLKPGVDVFIQSENGVVGVGPVAPPDKVDTDLVDAGSRRVTLRPGASLVATDVCVPLSRLAECVTETQRDIEASKLIAPIVGHIGDGNFHLTLLVDRESPAEVAYAEAFSHRLVERALAMDGTCTGEHGVGQGKMKYLLEEHGAPALAAMRSLKQAFDPLNIMNPGKIVALS